MYLFLFLLYLEITKIDPPFLTITETVLFFKLILKRGVSTVVLSKPLANFLILKFTSGIAIFHKFIVG